MSLMGQEYPTPSLSSEQEHHSMKQEQTQCGRNIPHGAEATPNEVRMTSEV